MYNEAKLDELVSNYKKVFNDRWDDENYKLVAVKHFQEVWNIDAEDFPSMLEDSLSETANLLASNMFFPKGMIIAYAKLDPEYVRTMFKELFNENNDLVTRMNGFRDKAEEINTRFFEESNTKRGNSYQNYNSISTYLWLKYPDKYYIYKFSEFKAFCKKIENDFIPKAGKGEENIVKCFSILDNVCSKLKKNPDFTNLYQGKMTDEYYKDEEYRTRIIDLVRYSYVMDIEQKNDEISIAQNETIEILSSENHWWLTASPAQWSFSSFTIGEEQSYTFLNSNGNKRRIYKNFTDAKVGDAIIAYESNPVKKIVGLAVITKIDPDEKLYFKKLEDFVNQIDYEEIKNIPELKDMEFLKNPNGSLFKLTNNEYETLMDIIRDSNPVSQTVEHDKYYKDDFLKEVYITSEEYDDLKGLLKNKRNIILQGAPGVGKTFTAKRLAFSIMGEKDETRVKVIQFHQSYSYEDFIMGYKPEGNGFVLKPGVFYNFCIEASNHPNNEYFFIIDEINRGNLSKIFGELLMLIENDKRAKEYANLAYTNKPFTVPSNLYIIGMMNTADRSLAMIDYALRRRFSFYEMQPAFDNPTFKKYLAALNNDTLNELIERVKKLNDVIGTDASLGSGFKIGHSYFCNLENKCNENVLNSIIKYDIVPMLEEYWFDNKEKVEEEKKILLEVF